MDIPKEAWMIFMLGGFAGILYSHFLRPTLKNLIKRLKSHWYMYTSARLTDAEARGYGWAWAAVMVEAESLDSVISMTRQAGKPQSAFNRGVLNAIDDIEHFECLKEERT